MNPDTSTDPVRLFLIGVNESLCRSLARYLASNPSIALVGETSSVALAGLLLPAMQPHVVLLDWMTLQRAAGSAVQALRRGNPDLRIICLARDREAYRAAATRAGADAMVSDEGLDWELEPVLHGFFPNRVHLLDGGALATKPG